LHESGALMYGNKRVAVVIPAYNEERLIEQTLAAIPEIVDRIYVVDDASPDGQAVVVQNYAQKDHRVVLLRHDRNRGPGGCIITGYRQSAQDGMDLCLVVGGDNQMDLSEAAKFLQPLVEQRADYVKGNRFLLSELDASIRWMPKTRFFANWLITGLTKLASGYFKIFDVVDGYTATTRQVIELINWDHAWTRYGYPMDFLIRLNAYGLRVLDVPRRAIYLPGERQSQIKGLSYAFQVSPMLIRGFFWRLAFKYLYRDFHPLVFFYYLAMLLLPMGLAGGTALVINKLFYTGVLVTGPRAVLVALLLISGLQFFLFAILFDMQESK
jgi:glycosyltransferase involved in cell wall biosynthesis